jgi:hypothetical protein
MVGRFIVLEAAKWGLRGYCGELYPNKIVRLTTRQRNLIKHEAFL